MAEKFWLGKVIDHLEYDFDGEVFKVIKYHPRVGGGYNMDEVVFSCEEMNAINKSLFGLLVLWLTYKQLGLNEQSLAAGICRALNIKGVGDD